MKTYSISKIGRACGLSRSTLLYYDRLRLLRPSGRTGSGYRYYTDADVEQLQRIRHFREAGLTLKEIRDVLSQQRIVSIPFRSGGVKSRRIGRIKRRILAETFR